MSREYALSVSRNLKSLNVQKNKLRSNIRDRKEQIRIAEADIKEYEARLDDLEKDLAALYENGQTIVSEHAVLRYLERHAGLDVKAIEDEIAQLPEELTVRQGKVIVTVLEEPLQNNANAIK